MNPFFNRFLKLKLDLAPIGIERRTENTPYFCTPRGASIFGWAGVDGIHYCFIRGFGDMVFAVSPMNAPDFVRPLAENFCDFLRLLLACGDASALEQAWQWDEAQFALFLQENPPAPEQKNLLSLIADATGLTSMEEPWKYINAIQTAFDYGKLHYSEDFFDPDMNPSIPYFDKTWKVFFESGFWGHTGRDRAGKEQPLQKPFEWAGREWLVPSLYLCGKGLVVDFCARVEPETIRNFLEKWRGRPEENAWEQEMQFTAENPFALDFRSQITLNGKLLEESCGYAVSYIPPEIAAAYHEESDDEVARWIVQHYELERACGWMLVRKSFPWKGKKPQQIQSLSVKMQQETVETPGPKFSVQKPGDRFVFSLPNDDARYALTVQEYEQQTLSMNATQGFDAIFPLHHTMMSFTVTPELPSSAYRIQDANRGDSIEDAPHTSSSEESAIGIIGGADGPTVVVLGVPQRENLRTVSSSLYYETPDSIEWRLVFRTRYFADAVFQLIETEEA